MSGVDESSELWQTCKVLYLLQYVNDNSSCENVFFCNAGTMDFIELKNLCDDKEDCGEEKSVCQAARISLKPFVKPLLYHDQKLILYCLPGLEDLENHHLFCIKETFIGVNYPLMGVKPWPMLLLPKQMTNCEHVFGELYVYLSCMNRCYKGKCPLKKLKYNSCSNIQDKETFTLTNMNSLLFFLNHHDVHKIMNDLFLCENNKCIAYNKVCDLVDNCGDKSDEKLCINNYQCKTSKLYITNTKKCDGIIDCMDYSDECNEECGKNIIPSNIGKYSAWILGLISVVLNLLMALKMMKSSWKTNANLFLNNVCKIIIIIGDLMSGIYLLFLALADTVIVKESYCMEQKKWLSSNGCAFLGSISTFGAHISLFSMTCLSMIRAKSVIHGGMEIRHYKIIFANIFLIPIISSIIAYIPLLNYYEDYFVNGIVYDRNIRLFSTVADKKMHVDVLGAYYGKVLKHNLSWNELKQLINLMFTNDYGEINSKRIHFYGNDGVCLFKYFVKNNDPQIFFVWTNLTIIFICFVIISICYCIINFKAQQSVKKVMCMMAKAAREEKDHRSERLQRSITRIIMTDFICWVPFIFICILHSLEVLDATFLYAFFSIFILPINSIINPFLYDEYLCTIAYNTKNRIIKTFCKGSIKVKNANSERRVQQISLASTIGSIRDL